MEMDVVSLPSSSSMLPSHSTSHALDSSSSSPSPLLSSSQSEVDPDDSSDALSVFTRRRPPRARLPDHTQLRIPARLLNAELTCAVCLGVIRSCTAVMLCLHRFCGACIERSLRFGKKECPQCRVSCPSKRNLRADPAFDAVISAIYPDLNAAEAANDQMVADIIQTTKVERFAASAAKGAAQQDEKARERTIKERKRGAEQEKITRIRHMQKKQQDAVSFTLLPHPNTIGTLRRHIAQAQTLTQASSGGPGGGEPLAASSSSTGSSSVTSTSSSSSTSSTSSSFPCLSPPRLPNKYLRCHHDLTVHLICQYLTYYLGPSYTYRVYMKNSDLSAMYKQVLAAARHMQQQQLKQDTSSMEGSESGSTKASATSEAEFVPLNGDATLLFMKETMWRKRERTTAAATATPTHQQSTASTATANGSGPASDPSPSRPESGTTPAEGLSATSASPSGGEMATSVLPPPPFTSSSSSTGVPSSSSASPPSSSSLATTQRELSAWEKKKENRLQLYYEMVPIYPTTHAESMYGSSTTPMDTANGHANSSTHTHTQTQANSSVPGPVPFSSLSSLPSPPRSVAPPLPTVSSASLPLPFPPVSLPSPNSSSSMHVDHGDASTNGGGDASAHAREYPMQLAP